MVTQAYRSGFERTVCRDLDSRRVSYRYESVSIGYLKEHRYTPDIQLANGILVELKGFFSPADRGKHLLVKDQHPELDIRFVFMDPTKRLSKKSKTTYADWCDRHGIKWSSKLIPTSWISERTPCTPASTQTPVSDVF
jgi:hypothetical protein